MNKNAIITLIEKKIKEHEVEVKGATKELASFSGKEGQARNIQIMNASKKLILKDKVIFHKAAMLALHDLLEELKQL